MQCLTLALTNPPAAGEYRVFNQFDEVYDLTQLAENVREVGDELGLSVAIRSLENPRIEREDHYYNPDHQNLIDLGYRPTHSIDQELRIMLGDLMKYRSRIEGHREAIVPDIHWDGSRRRVDYTEK